MMLMLMATATDTDAGNDNQVADNGQREQLQTDCQIGILDYQEE